ncbi:MAG: replication initiator protein A, partial [Defluviitaleaceae bacterium]|nr:replication initiator protein A [Defluviitaleaceae bacterium]
NIMTNKNSTSTTDRRMRYTRQAIVTSAFLQMPRFLYAGEFARNRISNNARNLYTLLLDRHKVSIKNGWYDESGEVYIYFKREEMEQQLGVSERTVTKVMQELKDLSLVEEKKQGLNKPNKIYLLSPVIGDGENPDPYVEPAPDYNPDSEDEYTDYNHDHEITTPMETQHLHCQPLNICTSEPANFTAHKPQNLSPNYSNYNYNKSSYNELSNTTATAASGRGGGEIPYPQILEGYNQLCETTNLRPIRSITGKRKTHTVARFKEYGLSGFFNAFDKVAASIFLCGGGDRGWKADFDWLISPANMQKVLEGKYDNDQCNIPTPQQRPNEPRNTGNTNKTERPDPFLERAMTAYATATRQATA